MTPPVSAAGRVECVWNPEVRLYEIRVCGVLAGYRYSVADDADIAPIQSAFDALAEARVKKEREALSSLLTARLIDECAYLGIAEMKVEHLVEKLTTTIRQRGAP